MRVLGTDAVGMAVIWDASLGAHAPGLLSPLQDRPSPRSASYQKVYMHTRACHKQNVLNFTRVGGLSRLQRSNCWKEQQGCGCNASYPCRPLGGGGSVPIPPVMYIYVLLIYVYMYMCRISLVPELASNQNTRLPFWLKLI